MSIVLFALLLMTGCSEVSPSPISESVDAKAELDLSHEEELRSIAREYMHYRTQAVLNRDMSILWSKYPALQEGMDRSLGINTERDQMKAMQQLDPIDANFDIESYGRIQVESIDESEIIIQVHGSMTYLRSDFMESGGEYLMKLHAQRKEDRWVVVKTDEYTLPEYKEWLKNKEK
ncbi:hypothetical protein FHS18_004877 [Paenibacillus phyllosphaerae]|uniref:Nuclear transport factor 2 family protein n=1 Tax=Paenibacillus phyllosphaerae TaxID=274593 RepID=A0A7W5B1L6_9BACL|nr:hypothetical protein [Paenibacillus phyllosphaerae]MBB3112775.1 hypothetical protein [Paenibacillus phyllosphaerae]